MRNIADPCLRRTLFLLAIIALSCGSSSAPPPASYVAPQGPSSGPQPPVAAQATPVVAAPGAPTAALSTPNPFALPCTVDANCLTHRCNVAVQRCTWPCQTDNDCMPGNACIAPTCLPKLQ
jgi:hypothetical protein